MFFAFFCIDDNNTDWFKLLIYEAEILPELPDNYAGRKNTFPLCLTRPIVIIPGAESIIEWVNSHQRIGNLNSFAYDTGSHTGSLLSFFVFSVIFKLIQITHLISIRQVLTLFLNSVDKTSSAL